MASINTIGDSCATRTTIPGRRIEVAPTAAQPAPTRQGDQVEFSDGALAAAQSAPSASGPRADLVARLRSEIQSGSYDLDAKFDKALDRMINSIDLSA